MYYYSPRKSKTNTALKKEVKDTFEKNKGVYGQKKMYQALRQKGVSIGKETLSKIMKEENLVSKYVRRRKKSSNQSSVNHDPIPNKVGRKFNNRKPLEVVASDLTYVDINQKWHYICLLIDLSHREIIGYAAGKNKDAKLVKSAWLSVSQDIRDICIFHSDRGSEFKNEEIEKILNLGKIERSLSRPGKPVDNAVCESMYDIVKTEFIFEEKFVDLADLRRKLSAWVWWYNNERLHSSLQYQTPVQSRKIENIGVTNESIANKKYQKFWSNIAAHKQKVLIDI